MHSHGHCVRNVPGSCIRVLGDPAVPAQGVIAIFVTKVKEEKSVFFGKLPSFGRERATPGFGPAIAGLPSAPSVSLFGVSSLIHSSRGMSLSSLYDLLSLFYAFFSLCFFQHHFPENWVIINVYHRFSRVKRITALWPLQTFYLLFR